MDRPKLQCSPRHKQCSPWHFDLVMSYRRERERQEIALDTTLNARGEKQHWKAMGGNMITFGQWLKAHRSGHER